MQYKTYQEAKIANPDREIYYSVVNGLVNNGFYSTIEYADGAYHACRPEDYCVPLEIFLASSKKLAHEWVNGDECAHVDRPSRVCTYIGKHPYVNGHFVLSKNGSVRYVNDNCLRKPETPEQKLERQRLESAYHLACIASGTSKWDLTFDGFKKDEKAVKRWLAVVDETKYLLND